ncbi:MAG: hypothetical protein PWR01_2093 [Clostridiales bacterium]|nr:hypothetical protein [Clostridiales bacterium]MDN5281020.1 hypothetical protein [Candidatus Ozemobacter sp.]
MKQYNKQQINYDGEFAIKLELMPVEVVSNTVPAYYYLILAVFLFLAIFLLNTVLGFSLQTCLIAWVSIMMALFLFERLVRDLVHIRFSHEQIDYRINEWILWKRRCATYNNSDFNHVTGKRYYSYFFGFDKPSLVREVVLFNRKEPQNSIVLARFVEKDYDKPERIWQDYWHKAATILHKPVCKQVDDQIKPIDPAEIEFQKGDGGAANPAAR